MKSKFPLISFHCSMCPACPNALWLWQISRGKLKLCLCQVALFSPWNTKTCLYFVQYFVVHDGGISHYKISLQHESRWNSIYLRRWYPVFNHYLCIDTIKEKFHFYKPILETSKAISEVKSWRMREALCQETKNILLHKCLCSKCLPTCNILYHSVLYIFI